MNLERDTPLTRAIRAATRRQREQLKLIAPLERLARTDARNMAGWVRRAIATSLLVPESELFPDAKARRKDDRATPQ
jgi:hypothetical protein